jgi:hypothetical protein
LKVSATQSPDLCHELGRGIGGENQFAAAYRRLFGELPSETLNG